MLVHIVHCSQYVTKTLSEDSVNVGNLFDEIGLKDVSKSSFFILCNGRKIAEDFKIEDGKTYHIIPRLPGGKGGFGSMLRAIGAQIEKTTSREACRDLSGRRMRDINNEKKLKEWLAKEAEREREREQSRQERLAKQLAQPQHKFDDSEYHEQRAKMQEDLQDALSKGLKRTHKKEKEHPCMEKKTKTAAWSGGVSKTEWIGVDIDSEESDSSCDTEANPGDSCDSEANSGDPHLHLSEGRSCSKDNRDCNENSTSSSVESSDAIKEMKTHDAHMSPNNEMRTDQPDSSQNIEDPHQTMPHSSVLAEFTKVTGSTSHDSTAGADEMKINKQQHILVAENEVSCSANSNEPIDLDSYNSSQDLAKLGMERLKNALMIRGLKCGGTLEERADRLFSVKGLSPDQIDPSLFAKGKGKGKKSK